MRSSGRGLARLAAFLVLALGGSAPARSLELSAGSGYLSLPATSYHYLTVLARAAIGSPDSQWALTLGATPPFTISGFTEYVVYGDISGQWTPIKDGFLRPIVGLGLGVYDDQVNSMSGICPSIVMRGGVKFGGDHLGASLTMNAYLGIYDPLQLVGFTIWQMVGFTGSIYVAL